MRYSELNPEIAYLRQPGTIRTRCQEIFKLGVQGKLRHFRVHMDRLPAVVSLVMDVTKENYPNNKIPYHSRWTHFGVGGLDRIAWLKTQLQSQKLDAMACTRAYYDIVVPSILLDAGAGMAWRYHDSQTDRYFDKSEGLAVASFEMFAQGLFSSDPRNPFQADAPGLEALKLDVLSNGFQVTAQNPLVAIDGRLQLMHNLGKALRDPVYFGGKASGRVGALADFLLDEFGATEISACDILSTVLAALGPIWPGRIQLHGVNMGDVWKHKDVTGDGSTNHLTPFHKLSQWMTYSLIEPLEWCGVKITDLDKLTGLAEYRNGGLFIDMNVLETVDPDALRKEWAPQEEFIVEWRALTVALLDEVAISMRKALNLSPEQLPLAKVLQGGTWAAGRKIAAKLRPDGASPVKIKSDGTVF